MRKKQSWAINRKMCMISTAFLNIARGLMCTHSCPDVTECAWVFPSAVPCAHTQVICRWFEHMLTLEFIWENPSLIRHGFAPICLGSHYFYPAADSSLHTQFSPTTISSHTKCPEPNFLSNEHLKSLQAQWKQALKEKKWGECMNSDSGELQKTLQSSPPKLFHTQDFSFYASPVYYIKETE